MAKKNASAEQRARDLLSDEMQSSLESIGVILYVSMLEDAAKELDHGLLKYQVLERAMQRTEASGDEKHADLLRMQVMAEASPAGKDLEKLGLMAKRLAYFDAHGDSMDDREDMERMLMWQYKYTLLTLGDFPLVDRKQLLDAADDFDRRSASFDPTRHSQLSVRRRLFERLGMVDEALAVHEDLIVAERGSISDCEACIVGSHVTFFSQLRMPDRVRQALTPFLERDDLKCTSQPGYSMNFAARLMLQLGDDDLAVRCHLRGLELPTDSPGKLDTYAEQILFQIRTGNEDSAGKIVDRSMPLAALAQNPTDQMLFSLAVLVWLRRMKALGSKSLPFSLPASASLESTRGEYDIDALISWAQSTADGFIRDFNNRAGNNYYTQKIEFDLAVLDNIHPLAIGKKRKRK